MCGNGARCICRYGYARGYAGAVQRVETTAGLVTGWRIAEDQYRIRLNTPSVMELKKQLDVDGRTYQCSYIELGRPGIPHLALELPALAKQDEDALRRLGRALRYHPALPKGANVNFYELTGPDEMSMPQRTENSLMRFWKRHTSAAWRTLRSPAARAPARSQRR